jgi:hypothetical protein
LAVEEVFDPDFLEEDFFVEDFVLDVFFAVDDEARDAGDFVCEAPHTPAIRIATKASRFTAYGN